MEELIIRYLQGDATPLEEKQISAWRGESSENERRYREIAGVWGLVGSVRPVPGTSPPPDANALIAEAETAGRGQPPRTPDRNLPRRPGNRWVKTMGVPGWSGSRAGLLVAAILILSVPLFLILGQILGNQGERATVLAEGEVTTGPGELTTVTLGDGTTIRLGPSSRLRLTDDGSERVAWLEGRGFFGVQRDRARPFRVVTDHGDAVVLGTRFEVRSEDEEFRVLVVEGEVEVSSGEGRARLGEGAMSRSHSGGAPTTSLVEDVYSQLDWMGNVLVFQATPASRAFSELERWYGVQVVMDDPSLRDLTVTATFTGQTAEDVAFVLCEIIGARCSIDAGLIKVLGRAKDPPGPVSVP